MADTKLRASCNNADCCDDNCCERGKRGKRGKRGHDGATGPTGPAGPSKRCTCPCTDCPECPAVALTGCTAVKSPYFIKVCCNCAPAAGPCICQPNTRDDGIDIAVQDVGQCINGTIVLVTGFGAEYLFYQVNALVAQGYRVINVTRRGNGDSDQPINSSTYDIWADDLRQVLDCLGVADVTLVGHSAGSGTVLHYAARHANCRVGRIVLASTVPIDSTFRFPDPVIDGLILAAENDYPATLEFFGGLVYSPQLPSSAALEYLTDLFLKSQLYSTKEQLLYTERDAPDANVLANDVPIVSASGIPTLILHGVQDAVTPFGIALQLNAGIVGSTLIPFPLSGHAVFTGSEGPAFTAAIADFASAGTCATCPPAPSAARATAKKKQPAKIFKPTTPASFVFPAAKKLVGWTSAGPVLKP